MKNMKRGAAAILALSLAVALPGCGSAPADSGSNSASTSIIELAAHEFTDADLKDLFSVPEIYFVQNAENVQLIDLLDYDTGLIQKISLEGDTLDLTQPGEQNITLLLTVDQAKLAEALMLDDGNTYTGTVDLQVTAKIDVIADADIDALLTENPDAVVVGTDNQFYELAAPAEEGEAAAQGTDGQPTETAPIVTTTAPAEKPKVSTKKNADTATGNKTSATASAPNQSTGNTGATGSTNTGSSTPSQSTTNTGSTDGTTSKPSQPTNAGNSGNTSKPSGSSGSQTGGSTAGGGNSTANTSAATPEPEPPKHEHTWEPVYTNVHHDEVGHYETVTVQEAYDEPVYGYRYVCGKCGYITPYTGDEAAEDINDHLWVNHDGGRYASKKVQVDTIHHEAVTEQKYVVDQAAYDEQVVSGYKCSCGETK